MSKEKHAIRIHNSRDNAKTTKKRKHKMYEHRDTRRGKKHGGDEGDDEGFQKRCGKADS